MRYYMIVTSMGYIAIIASVYFGNRTPNYSEAASIAALILLPVLLVVWIVGVFIVSSKTDKPWMRDTTNEIENE